MGEIVSLIVLATTIWVGVDSSARDFSQSAFCRSTFMWIFGCLALWIVVFPIYLFQRNNVPPKRAAPAGWAPPIPALSSQGPAGAGAIRTCGRCGRAVQATAVRCPYCASDLSG